MITRKASHRYTTAQTVRSEQIKEETQGSKGRSRWIATLILIALLMLGGWAIAQRVMPYAFSSGSSAKFGALSSADGMQVESAVVAEPRFAARADVPMVKSSTLPVPIGVASNSVGDKASNNADIVERKIQKTGNLSIVVESVPWTVERISEIAREYGGDVASTNFYTDKKDRVVGVMRIRVRSENFDEAFEKVKKEIALSVENESTDTQDVTEQYIDLKARLKNKRHEEEVLLAILERAKEVKDVLNVTREVSRVRGEIERLEAQLRYMDARTDFSMIVINIKESERIVLPDTAWRPGEVARKAVNRLIADTQKLIDKAIQFLVWFVPAFILYVLVIAVLWRVVKRIGVLLMRRWERQQRKKM